MATMMAMRGAGGAGMQQGGQGGTVVMRPPQGAQPGAGQPPRQPGAGGMQPGGAGMRGGQGGFNVNDLFDRLPVVSLADLKVGDAVAASTASGADASRVTAIRFISGVEPFFRASQAAGAGQRGGQGGVSGGFSIPGLDGGFGTP